MRHATLAVCAIALFALAGCGGGGSSSSGGSGVVPAATRTAQLQPGDTWTYAVTGTWTPPGGGTASSVSGTMTMTIASTTLNAQALLAETMTWNLALPTGQQVFSEVEYINQLSDGTVMLVGDNSGPGGSVRALVSPVVYWPSTWPIPASTFGVNYSDGTHVVETVNTLGPDTVQTPVATFNAWRVVRSISQNGTTIINGTGTTWFAPNFGLVSAQLLLTEPDGAALNLSAMLQSTDVIVPAH